MEDKEETTALIPYQGELEEYKGEGPNWTFPEEQVIYIPGPEKEEEPVPGWFGKGQAGSSGPTDQGEGGQPSGEGPSQKDNLREELRDWLRREREQAEKYSGLKGEVEEEELKAKIREFKKKYKDPSKLEKFLKGAGRTWKGVKEAAGPRGRLPSGFYVGRPMPGLYVPKVPAWRPTTEFMPAGEAHTPHLSQLRTAGAPGPSQKIRVPFRDVERFEGIGTAMGRLRVLEQLPAVDRAVYAEIHANGDIDTPSHVKSEVKQLGFSKREINDSLKRLREFGLVVPTGNKYKGEKELMVV